MVSEPKRIPFGNGTLIATERDFVNGFQAGHLVYMTAMKNHPEPYTDKYLVEIFLDKLEDMHCTSSYGIGFSVGWLHTLATKGGQ